MYFSTTYYETCKETEKSIPHTEKKQVTETSFEKGEVSTQQTKTSNSYCKYVQRTTETMFKEVKKDMMTMFPHIKNTNRLKL